ncbi:MAG: class I SAM-dependent methyltransferase [Chloroflexi bacterium]|nr:class I SAM-dependent methyltransferase [Chloroflexota bacterium]
MTSPSYLFNADNRARLAAAEALLDDGTIRHVQHLGVVEGWRCLELGAGGGSIARWISGAVGASGWVVATDLDTRQLRDIQQNNLEVRQHDIVSDALEEATFDLVHARLVLEHLVARDRVLEKLVRALRPGGWLLVEDVDYLSAVPVSALGAELHARTQAVRLEEFSQMGVDHSLGRALTGKLRALGLADVGNEGRVWLMEAGSPGARWFKLSLDHLRGRLVGPGKLTHAEVDRMLEYFDDPGWSAMSPIIMAAWGRRPS